MKRSIKEQIDILRNSIAWGLQNHPDVPIFCREAADTMEIMQARIELLEKVVERVHEYELRVYKKDWTGRTKDQIEQAIEIARLEMFLQVTMLEE